MQPNASDELAKDLAELLTSQAALSSDLAGGTTGMLPPYMGKSVEERLKDLLKKAEDIARKFEPESMSVSVGFPIGAQLSFSWKLKEDSKEVFRVNY